MSRADIPASSKILAQVFRKTCDVTHVMPAVPRAVLAPITASAGHPVPEDYRRNQDPLDIFRFAGTGALT
jgi:hypothetical protein